MKHFGPPHFWAGYAAVRRAPVWPRLQYINGS